MNKKLVLMISMLSLCISITGCSKDGSDLLSQTSQIEKTSETTESIGKIDTFIKLGNSTEISGDGVTSNNNKITITSAGTYSISGTLSDGQVIVNAGENDKVYILLDGANITCSNSSPIYVMNSKKTVVALADGSKNYITDSEKYVLEDTTTDEPNAAIFSKDDLTIIGNGYLEVNANYNNGITSKDDLKIESGNITVKSVSDGLRGRDSIVITNGNINVKSDGDGMKSNNDEDAEKGYISIKGGIINITSGEDGIQAETKVVISDGNLNITSGEGSANSITSNNDRLSIKNEKNPNTEITTDLAEAASEKAIKASADITIDGGKINIDSSDDSIHSNSSLSINGGDINITSGDDGIHSDSSLEINDGKIKITKSYEGIESESITINNGDINIISSDDGINAAGGNDSSSINGRVGQNEFSSSNNGKIKINGGNIVVDASGDGIDANGSIYMKDGVVIVNGPANNGNGALDYDEKFEVSGGVLVASGGLGMAQSPSTTSSQNSVSIALSSQEANNIIHIESELGEEILTFSPSKQYQSVVISSPKLEMGSKYTVYTGGSSTGTSTDGLYSEGIYKDGTKVLDFTVSDKITTVAQEGVSIGGNKGAFGGGRGNMGGTKPIKPQ